MGARGSLVLRDPLQGTLRVHPPPQTDQGRGPSFCLDPGLKAFAERLKLNLKFSSSKNASRPMTLCSGGSGQDPGAGPLGQWTVRIFGWKQILAARKGRTKPRAGGGRREAPAACLPRALRYRHRAASGAGGCHTPGQGRGARVSRQRCVSQEPPGVRPGRERYLGRAPRPSGDLGVRGGLGAPLPHPRGRLCSEAPAHLGGARPAVFGWTGPA